MRFDRLGTGSQPNERSSHSTIVLRGGGIILSRFASFPHTRLGIVQASCLTIVHRIMLHENLGEAHRKHAYQLMANELHLSHPLVSGLYMGVQLLVSVGFVFACPWLASASGLSLVLVHWVYLICALVLLAVAYVVFMRKYYWMHEEYLASIGQGQKARK